jgi:hypothetical protein
VSVHGFGVSMIIDLVDKGFAILTHEKVRADGKMIGCRRSGSRKLGETL